GGSLNPDGSAKTAYFPQDRKELKRTFSRILSALTNNLTTRTSTVFANAATSSIGRAEQYASGFVPLVEQPWRGQLTRTRVTCNSDGLPEEQPVDRTRGDDFAANLNATGASSRKFYTFLPSSPSTSA